MGMHAQWDFWFASSSRRMHAACSYTMAYQMLQDEMDSDCLCQLHQSKQQCTAHVVAHHRQQSE